MGQRSKQRKPCPFLVIKVISYLKILKSIKTIITKPYAK